MYESTVDSDYARHCGPDICPFCDHPIEGPEHKPEECEAALEEEG
jgi:hypothetical protein